MKPSDTSRSSCKSSIKDSTPITDGYSVVLKTATTGLDDDAEIVEIAIVCTHSGKTLINTLVKPKNPIPPSATVIHGITNVLVANSPSWAEIHDQVMSVMYGRIVLIYNADYDIRLIKQTAGQYDRCVDNIEYRCVMESYADIYNSGFWAKLSDAIKDQGGKPGGSQRALEYCRRTRALALKTVPEWGLKSKP